MKNIFENAKFGDRFRTRDGQMVIYGKRSIFREELHWIHSKDNHTYRVYDDGYVSKDKEYDLDIVSRWQEHIDEEELNELAKQEELRLVGYNGLNLLTQRNKYHADLHNVYELMDMMYKAGYRKAKQG